MRGKASHVRPCPAGRRITPAHAGKRVCRFVFGILFQDHPRACGEKIINSMICDFDLGSPPRMRGKDEDAKEVGKEKGITPAHAGKRILWQLIPDLLKDHPRACGEKSRSELYSALMKGSPPRMRGKGANIGINTASEGITPAHAGKRQCRTSSCVISGDHPRACGEKARTLKRTTVGKGSPPRMRGKVDKVNNVAALTGITPAHAGKRTKYWVKTSDYKDHPRACGEKELGLSRHFRPRGSPPRMRGKVEELTREVRKHKDHPRACGEKCNAACRFVRRGGSPPRMRGKGCRTGCRGICRRITPAHAGKRPSCSSRAAGARDHPRACGEKAVMGDNGQRLIGSPPRMRGKD